MARIITLCGLPGSGKSTFARKWVEEYENWVIVSSDAVRKELYGDESIQGNPKEVFATVDKKIKEAIDKGLSVIYDATNIQAKTRMEIVKKFPDAKHFCVYFPTPIKVCFERNENRERKVPKFVIHRMHKLFEVPYWDEGFRVVAYYSESLDTLMPIPLRRGSK